VGGERIPVTVIGGYLGAGKTTLLNHVLRHASGERIAVLVNDFGAINIDADLIESVEGETIRLTNGCVCCSLTDGFAAALTSLRDSDRPPHRVIVETSGVADPVATAQWAHLPGFRLDAIVVLADADAVRRLAKDDYVGKHVLRQLRGGDVVVLNKVDLVDPTRLAALHEWLSIVAPEARVADATNGVVPSALLFGVDRRTDPASESEAPPEFRQWSFTNPRPVDADAVHAVLAASPSCMVRAKGILIGADGAARLVNMVGRRITVDALELMTPPSRLVVIATPGVDDMMSRTLEELGRMFA